MMQLQQHERPLAVLSGPGAHMLWLHAATLFCERIARLRLSLSLPIPCLAQAKAMT